MMEHCEHSHDILRQVAVVLSVLATLVSNALAEALPINGQSTAAISDRFKVYFVPPGYVFSIWGLIYVGLVALAIFQALPAQRENPRLREASWWIALGGVANSAWIVLWHYEQFALTVLVMLVLLASLIIAYLKLNAGHSDVGPGERWTVDLTISVYLGWISVATIANISSVLKATGWNQFGLSAEVWMLVVLTLVLGIGLAMNLIRKDIAYAGVLIWALCGIAVKERATGSVAIPTWVVLGLVAVSLAVALVRGKADGGGLPPKELSRL